MKQVSLLHLFVLLLTVALLQSCMNNDDDFYPQFPDGSMVAIVTVHTIKSDNDSDNKKPDYYLKLDNGKTIYPKIRNAVYEYKAIDGQRAYAIYKYLDNEPSRAEQTFDFEVELYQINNILTKDIIPLTTATNDSIGNDKINIASEWIAEGYITMEFSFYGSFYPQKKHMLNLVYDTEKEIIDEEGYLNLEVRHNAFGDEPAHIGYGTVSFKTDAIADKLAQVKGIKIKVNTIYNGTEVHKLTFEAENTTKGIRLYNEESLPENTIMN